MAKDKANHEELKSMYLEATKALAALESLRETVKNKVRAQGTALWLNGKILEATKHVQHVVRSIAAIDKTLLDDVPADRPAEVKV